MEQFLLSLKKFSHGLILYVNIILIAFITILKIELQL